MNRSDLSPREQEVFDFILEYMDGCKFSPSMRMICKNVHLGSVSSAHRYVHSLIDKGWLKVTQNHMGQIVTYLPASENV